MDVIPDLYLYRNPQEIRKGKQAPAAKVVSRRGLRMIDQFLMPKQDFILV